MKNKLNLMQVDFVLQSFAIVAMIISMFLVFLDVEEPFLYVLFILAGIQVVSNLFLGFKYDDKRRKEYLKMLFWIHGFGSIIACFLGSIEIEFLGIIAFLFLGFTWGFFPFFMAFWSLYNSWKGMQDAKLELNNHFML